ncbi:MAG TPA: hypothetical protein VFS00_08505 [Polyangiaceae bacterium]|nr:hypothetical protein [Polyangiaceae bacterium]
MPSPLYLLAAHAPITFTGLFDSPGLSESKIGWWKLFLSLAALMALFYEASREAEGDPVPRRTKRRAAGVFMFAASVCYFQFFQIGYPEFYHRWEFFHYYMGSKYFPELGYDGLYKCTAIAESDLGFGREVRTRKLRDIGHTNLIVSTAETLAHPELCKNAFSPEKWEAFKKDVSFFREVSGSGQWWRDMQTDHGYNPPPVWGIMGWAFSWLHPAVAWYMKLLSCIDVALFAGMFGCVAWAFGWRVAAIGIVFWGTQGASPFYWTGGAFLRQDWLFYAIVSACMIRKRKYFWGGAFMTYSTLLRVFPLYFFGGWLVVAAAHAYRAYRRREPGAPLALGALLHPQLKRVAAGALVAGAVLIPASAAVAGKDAWPAFISHIKVHKDTPVTNHMGWRTIVSHGAEGRMQVARDNKSQDAFATWKQMRRDRVKQLWPVYYGGIGIAVGMFVYACWRLKNLWVVQALGCLLATMLIELTCYYYSFFIYGAMLSRGRRPIEFALLACSVLSQVASVVLYHFTDDKNVGMSVAFLLLALFMVAMYMRNPFQPAIPATKLAPVEPEEPTALEDALPASVAPEG